MPATTTVVVSIRLEGLNVSVHLASLVRDVRETSTNVYQTHVQRLVLKTASNLSTITIATASLATWGDTATLRSTSALTHPARTEVFAQPYREVTSAFAMMAFTARTVNIQDTLAILTRVKMEDTAEHRKLVATSAIVLLAYQVSTVKLTP